MMARTGFWVPALLLLGCRSLPEPEAEPWQPPAAFLKSGYYSSKGLSKPGKRLRAAITKALEKEWPLWKVREYSIEKYLWDPEYMKPKGGRGWRGGLHVESQHDAGSIWWYATVDDAGNPQQYRVEITKDSHNWVGFGHVEDLFGEGRKPDPERAFRQELSGDFVVTYGGRDHVTVYTPEKVEGGFMKSFTWKGALKIPDLDGLTKGLAVVVYAKNQLPDDLVMDGMERELKELGFRHVIFQRHTGKRRPDGRPILRE